tara:strand:- start:74 stop:313 length:240 start_codon:yes stop_codon:yes gene_type:complete
MNRYQLNYKYRDLNTIQKQEIWRQKQIQIFYGSGKPIFTMDEETQHIRSHNNPYFYKDKYELDKPKIVKENKQHTENTT